MSLKAPLLPLLVLISAGLFAVAPPAKANEVAGLVASDVCTSPSLAPIQQVVVSSTTAGAQNHYDIATTCGVQQQGFQFTGASLDVAAGVITDANCVVDVVADPTGTPWDLSLYVLEVPSGDAACLQLPKLADPQCITMDDDDPAGVTENLSWGAVAGTAYFVIVDGFLAATGTFDLTITVKDCNLVPVELQSFSVDR